MVDDPEGNGYNGIQPAQDPDEPLNEVVTAFIVVLGADGRWISDADVDKFKGYRLIRKANLNDFIPGCSQVISDTQLITITQNVVQNVLNAQMQMANAARQQMESAQLQRVISEKGGFKGPGGDHR